MSSQSESERETVRLWRAYRTVHEMCADRGYEFEEGEGMEPLDDFKRKFSMNGISVDRNLLAFSARPSAAMLEKHADRSPPPGTVRVEFNGDSNVGIRQLRTFAHFITENNFATGIFISAANVTPSAFKVIPSLLPTVLEVFQEQDLLVNITRHELVPKHVLLSDKEKKALLERYRVKETQLPRIQVTDPVAKYLGLKRGQVVKIIRQSVTAGRYASYRWAI
ncbi:hypothetical protein FH972_023178 [Carpinus fangiana]|uniref:RNA polymerase subunit H/Rpb5 C-terminal domain-containing protein n=1 Tax=Carpinus fangiana TaxID=176857 RepID=A0A5N6KUF3_9ROSI|nr:hypothetical protein FH972_023178 [Carpinus fangiana]